MWLQELGREYQNLTIIKIDVDPEDPEVYLPLLQPDGSGEELSPPTALTEIWREPPPAHRIHAFVTLTNLPMELSGLHLLYKAAHTLYHQVWGHKSDDIFEAVPGRGDYRYLTTQKIVDLGLKALSYKAKFLLVRKEFEIAHKELEGFNAPPNESGGVVVTGQPGIGKTCFLYYLLLQLLCEKKTVAFQVNNHFVLFQEAGVHFARNSSGSEDAGIAIPHETWVLTDSHTDYAQPCKAFVTASENGAWIVQTTAPSSKNWRRWHTDQEAYTYWMDVSSFDELSVLGAILHLDLKCLHDNYYLWGPVTRTCITLADPKRLGHHEMAVAVAALRFTKDVIQFGDLDSLTVSHQLFSVRPNLEEGSRQDVTVDFATRNIFGFVLRTYAKQDHATQLSFYRMLRGHSWFGTSAGYFFETHVLLWIRYASTLDYLACTPAMPRSPSLRISTCGDNVEFFSNVDELKNVDKNETRKCWVPASQTFPTCDAIVLTNNFVITMTIASKHGAKSSGFEKISNSLPSDFLATRDWCHIFLTDSEDKAGPLRQQKLTETPQKMAIRVYSAVVNIEEWDSLLTAERVETMENDRSEKELLELWKQQSRVMLPQKQLTRG